MKATEILLGLLIGYEVGSFIIHVTKKEPTPPKAATIYMAPVKFKQAIIADTIFTKTIVYVK